MNGKTKMLVCLNLLNMFPICFRIFPAMFPTFFRMVFQCFPPRPPRIPIHRSLWNAQSSFQDDFDNIELKLAVGLQKWNPQYWLNANHIEVTLDSIIHADASAINNRMEPLTEACLLDHVLLYVCVTSRPMLSYVPDFSDFSECRAATPADIRSTLKIKIFEFFSVCFRSASCPLWQYPSLCPRACKALLFRPSCGL